MKLMNCKDCSGGKILLRGKATVCPVCNGTGRHEWKAMPWQVIALIDDRFRNFHIS